MNFLGFGTMFLTVLFTYRSFSAAILLMVPLLLANGVANAYSGFRNVGINLHTLPVITIGIGFGIDYGMYILSRVLEEMEVAGDVMTATARAIETSGKAVTFTALSFAVATLPWFFSHIRFNADMAILLFLWMTVSFLAAVTLLPALLAIVRPRFLLAAARGRAAEETARG